MKRYSVENDLKEEMFQTRIMEKYLLVIVSRVPVQ
jgi:hypothetical protein